MAKNKVIYTCQSCGARFPKWAGQCADCGAWNTLLEEKVVADQQTNAHSRLSGGYAAATSEMTLLSDITVEQQNRMSTGSAEFDHVLGGGLVAGSIVLVGGDPGIGKSTLLLQLLTHMSQYQCALYITGEESLQQVSMRAKRLNLNEKDLFLLAETQIEKILAVAEKAKPRIMVVDSIQTIFTDFLPSAPGSVGQVRDSAAQLVRFAKQTGTAILLIGHVTKEGALAGPRVLEHMVDSVIYFEGKQDSRHRVLRAVKNRFGAVNELGVFAMTDKGLRDVSNPSAMFLANFQQASSGSAVLVTWEGSRPLLVEVQALLNESHLANPRRVTVGLDQNRMALLLAVLQRHGQIASHNQDVFINVVGGIKVTETAADLAILMAVYSSLYDRPLPSGLISFGEVGLSGEIRPVQSGQERLREAVKLGFTTAIIPKANTPKKNPAGMKIIAVEHLQGMLEALS